MTWRMRTPGGTRTLQEVLEVLQRGCPDPADTA